LEQEGENDAEQRELLDVQHSFIDFEYLILGFKLYYFNNNQDIQYKFDDLELSKLMELCS
jgi:hypothetical protein